MLSIADESAEQLMVLLARFCVIWRHGQLHSTRIGLISFTHMTQCCLNALLQMGQVMAIQSGGLLRATPHCVRAAAAGEPGVSRNTFAVFMQPETSLLLEAPRAAAGLGALLCMDSGHWAPGMR